MPTRARLSATVEADVLAAGRTAVPLVDFEGDFRGASGELGGLTSWQRLRGGPRWIGQDKNVQRRPNIETIAGHSCVHFSDNPFGDRF